MRASRAAGRLRDRPVRRLSPGSRSGSGLRANSWVRAWLVRSAGQGPGVEPAAWRARSSTWTVRIICDTAKTALPTAAMPLEEACEAASKRGVEHVRTVVAPPLRVRHVGVLRDRRRTVRAVRVMCVQCVTTIAPSGTTRPSRVGTCRCPWRSSPGDRPPP